MKLHRFALLAALSSSPAFAQTNTFPASGNVGIGTTNPSTILHVTTNSINIDEAIRLDNVGNAADNGSKITWHNAAQTYPGAFLGATRVGATLGIAQIFGTSPNWVNTAAVERMRIDPQGNVGIGTVNPSAKLTVFAGTLGTTAGSFLDISNQSTFTGNHTQLITRLVRTADGDGWEKAAIQLLRRTDVTDQAYISLYRDNVGIGAITPVAKLHVQGNPASGPGNEALWVDNNGVPFVTRREAAGGGTVEVGTVYSHNMSLITNGSPIMFLGANGSVGIGTSNPQHKLAVNGTIKAKEVIVETTGWSDYVFADDYRLAPLAEVEAHIKTNKHLPGIPSAAQVAENGVNLGDVQTALLAKVEELTLHLIAQDKSMKALQSQNAALQARVQQLETR
jgi:hypothetical protein